MIGRIKTTNKIEKLKIKYALMNFMLYFLGNTSEQ